MSDRLSLGALLLASVASAALVTAPGAAAKGRAHATTDVAVPASNAFTFDLGGRLVSEGKGNFAVSPLSLSTALTMTWAGAKGATAGELAKALHLPGPAVHAAFEALQRRLSQRREVELRQANRLFLAPDERLVDAFAALTKAHYGAGVGRANFAAEGGEVARGQINAWVKQVTKGSIPELVKPKILDARTRLVLANALYFKGAWHQGFDPDDTIPAPFHAPGGDVQALYMQHLKAKLSLQTVAFPSGQGGYALLALPYRGKRFELVAALPDEGTGADAVLADLGTRFDQLVARRPAPTDVRVLLPKFEMRFNANLVPIMKALGVRAAFDERADLSGINGKTDLFVTAIVHEAWVKVDEVGTEAAAATAVVTGRKGIPQVALFRADRPFLFLIRDTSTGAIVFLGRVSDPTQS
jgi:serpin B